MADNYPATGRVAYEQGREAYKLRALFLSNPHQRYSYNWEQWRAGFMDELNKEEKKEP